MSYLPAQLIRKRDLIQPFSERTRAFGRSYGLSAAGYDVRLAEDLWLWPFWGRLASTMEHFTMPNDLVAEVKDKSTNARKFVFVQNTVIEPGWRGYLTLELTRFLPWPIKLKKGTPIAQILFSMLAEPTEQPYDGKYQDQKKGVQPAIMEQQLELPFA
jgi:dCTP deaminase